MVPDQRDMGSTVAPQWGFTIGCDGLAMNMKWYIDDVRID